jgi:subtilisin-like proprotein convertase family protein
MVGDYGSFKVFEVSSEQAENLKQKNQGTYRDEYNVVMLNAGQIDTTSQQAEALQLASAPKRGKQMHLVQFPGPIKSDWYNALVRTGVKVVSYIPSNAYLVYGNEASIRRVKRMSGARGILQWSGDYKDEYRVQPGDPAFVKGKDGERIIKADKSEVTLYGIQLFKDPVENSKTIQELDQIKTDEFKQQYEILHYRNLIVPLSPENLKDIADNPDVVSIARYTMPRKFDERQNFIISNNLTPTPANWLTFLASNGFTQAQFTASNFAVNVSDSGLDDGTTSPNHFALYVSGNTTMASRVIYNRLEGTPNGGSTLQGCDGHGTINGNIVAGFVPDGAPFDAFPHADAGGFRYGMGVAPFVKVGSSVIFDPNTFTFPTYPNLESRAYNDGARISSNSWGGGFADGSYSTDTQAYDALVRDAQPAGSAVPVAGNQEHVIIFAAGNDGPGGDTIGTQACGKNIIAVGASENVRAFGGADGCGTGDTGADNANDIIGFSSRGPTDDLRKKPDIQAPGTHITGGLFQEVLAGNPVTGNGNAGPCFTANGVCGGPAPGFDFFPLGQEWYTASSGTSHSCPAIAGIAALIRQRFINASLTPASPALTRGLLMNTARFMTGAGANDTLPSNNQGMGLANIAQILDIRLSPTVGTTPTIIRDQVGADTFTATGQQRTITGNVSDNTKPFRVTLAWTDPPGPTTGNSFINNLDLEVTVGGQSFRGNVFTGANSSTGGSADIRNTSESVFIPAGVTGPFVVRVIATNIAGDGVPNVGGALDQDYALIVYNAEAVNQPVIAGAGATIEAEGCTPVNGAIDPGETVTVSFCLQNVGTLDTANLVATLQATGGVTAPSGPQNYGAVIAGGAAVCRSFTFTADDKLACGGMLTASLQLQDGATDLGTVTFNFTLGGVNIVGPTAFSNATSIVLPTDTPAAGDGLGPATPYPSDIVVAGLTGNVTKVTVTMTNFEHTFPDDFDIVLEGPGGQKVMLMSDVGGSTDINGVTLTLDDAAASALPDTTQLVSGTFRPTDIGATDTMNAPAPGPPYATVLSAFNGTNPNGTWRLWVRDEFAVDDGSIGGGWTINITTAQPVCATTCEGPAPCTLTITCPTGVTGVTSTTGGTTGTVTFADPVIGGDCTTEVTVTCTPPSGSSFPAGVTTVTCTASADGATPVACSFTVNVFNACLQDDSNPNIVMLFNTTTGDYTFCCPAMGGNPVSGKGTITKKGSTVSLNANVPGFKINASITGGTVNKGEAALKTTGGQIICTIRDTNTLNNTCSCGAPAPPPPQGK